MYVQTKNVPILSTGFYIFSLKYIDVLDFGTILFDSFWLLGVSFYESSPSFSDSLLNAAFVLF